jgi:hypothetical protein
MFEVAATYCYSAVLEVSIEEPKRVLVFFF